MHTFFERIHNEEEIEITVPYDPQRIAILDLAALDIIDNLGMGDRVVGMADTSIDYLSDYAENSELSIDCPKRDIEKIKAPTHIVSVAIILSSFFLMLSSSLIAIIAVITIAVIQHKRPILEPLSSMQKTDINKVTK